MVALNAAADGVYGARMTGGGFGGFDHQPGGGKRRGRVQTKRGEALPRGDRTRARRSSLLPRAPASAPSARSGAMDFLQAAPHRRLNPLTGEWVLVSPHRTERPWMGQTEARSGTEIPAYDPDCYLCPGNRRAHGAVNPRYAHTFVFDNDFPALLPESSRRKDRPRRLVGRRGGARRLPGDLLLAATRPDARADERRGHRARRSDVARSVPGARRHRRHQRRADLREPRRHDGGEQPAPALPGVGDRVAAQRDGEGARDPDRLLARARPAPAPRLPQARAGGG